MTGVSGALAALAISPAVAETIHDFMVLFQKWNRSINLSAARSDDALLEQIVDSLHVVPHLRAVHPMAPTMPVRVLDVGAGGGLPSVVAAVCLPDVHITALEPVHKKHAFLRTAARELSLSNLEPRAERLEDHKPIDYDAAMSRATFDLRDWLLQGCSYVRPGGVVLGFEAVPRQDLPPTTRRHPYALDGKARAIVALHLASDAAARSPSEPAAR